MSATRTTEAPAGARKRARDADAFAERMLTAAGGTFEIFSIYLGDRLGLYEHLAGAGPLTSTELAEGTGTAERYVREWLEQQAVIGILEVDDPALPADLRRFRLDPARAEVLADPESLNYLAPLAQLIAGAVHPLGRVVSAYRTGDGVPFVDYGPDCRQGQGRVNRAMFLHQLGPEWLASIPDVDARLRSEPPARVADVGCGVGWSSVGVAHAYPGVRVDGFDPDGPSVELARRHAAGADLGGRVRFHAVDAGEVGEEDAYDLVLALECLHDMSDPVSVLRSMGRMARPDGAVIVADERVADAFMGEGGDVEWLMYGWSILHCLPVGMAERPSAATGTVLRTPVLERYAREAGFREVEVLPIENFVFRFYRLRA